MLEHLRAFYESMIELSPEEVIGAIVIGLALAMACSGLCQLAQKKASSPYSPVCGLIFAVIAASLAIGVGHARKKYVGSHPLVGGQIFRSALGPGPPTARRPGRGWLQEADADRDGHLTPEEAARFVREADPTGKGWVALADFDRSRRGRPGPPSVVENPPGPATLAPGGGRP